ncbi:MAG: M23 family metallopeptidase, partial [Sphingomonadaceae bacterium]
IGSRYGMRRHPILGYKRMHRGVDYRAGQGTPIYAVTDGQVASAGRAGGCGIAVRLNHAQGLSTRYCHMSRMAVRAGQSVQRGQVIGYVGSTGLSTGPHLHYEMYRNGQTIDPLSVQYVTRALLAGSQLTDFRNRLAQLRKITPGAALKPVQTARTADRTAALPTREIEKLSASYSSSVSADRNPL